MPLGRLAGKAITYHLTLYPHSAPGGNIMGNSYDLHRRIHLFLIFGVILFCCTSPVLGEEKTWTTTTADEFQEGTMDATDAWSSPGNVQLARNWLAARQVNDNVSESRDFPRLASRLGASGKGFFFIA